MSPALEGFEVLSRMKSFEHNRGKIGLDSCSDSYDGRFELS